MRKEFTYIVLKLIYKLGKHINYVPKDWSRRGRGPINYSCFPYLRCFDVLGLSSYQVSFRHTSVLAYKSQHNTKLGLPKIYKPMIPKPWMRKVRTSSHHLFAEIRAIYGTWYNSIFFKNKTVLFVKIESWD